MDSGQVVIVAMGMMCLYVCIDHVMKGHYGMAIAFFGYTVANAGLYVNNMEMAMKSGL